MRLVRLGVWYHITARGIERGRIFRDDRDRTHFLELLSQLPERFQLRIFAFALMENHYHLLLELREPNLSQAMRWLQVSYSVWFNRRHRRSGYLFQGRFKSIIVDPDSWGLALSAYIHLNPVRTAARSLSKSDRQQIRAGAGRAPTAEEIRARLQLLRSHQWSSYRFYAGHSTAPPWLEHAEVLNKGGGPEARQKQNYRRYVETQIRQGLRESPWEELKDRFFLGAVDFINDLKKHGRAALKNNKTPPLLRERIPIGRIIKIVEEIKGQRWKDFKDRHGDGGLALVLMLAVRRSGLTQAVIAQQLGLEPSINISSVLKRYDNRIAKSAPEKKSANKAVAVLDASE